MPSRPEGDTNYPVIQAFSTQLRNTASGRTPAQASACYSMETMVLVIFKNSVLAFCSSSASCPSSTWTHSCQGDPSRSLHKVTILCSEPAAILSSLPYIKCLIQWCLAYSSTSLKDLENNKMLHGLLKPSNYVFISNAGISQALKSYKVASEHFLLL